jgi:hypothetical protein
MARLYTELEGAVYAYDTAHDEEAKLEFMRVILSKLHSIRLNATIVDTLVSFHDNPRTIDHTWSARENLSHRVDRLTSVLKHVVVDETCPVDLKGGEA